MPMYTSTTRRRREGEIVSRIIILFFRIAYEIYRYEGKKLDALLAELYTALVIRKLARNGEPVSISAAPERPAFRFRTCAATSSRWSGRAS